MIKRIWKTVLRILKFLSLASGIIFILLIIFSFTDFPWIIYHKLGTYNHEISHDPDYIVVMGAGGMPGRESLMRCYYAAAGANLYPDALVIIAMPTSEGEFYESEAMRMAKEIQLKGVPEERFIFESIGTNTATQAMEIFHLLKSSPNNTLLIVTSPEHMFRCIRAFEKCGFEKVFGLPTFDGYLDEQILLTKEERAKRFKPLYRNVNLRYNMWNYLKIEIALIREGIAITWYKIRGYI